MKLIVFIVGVLVLTVSVGHASETMHDHKNMNKKKMMEKVTDGKNKKLSSELKNELINLFKVNEKLYASFYDYDGALVEENAKRLRNSISKISDPMIKKLLKDSKSRLDKIKSKNPRKLNDNNYHMVSMTLINLLNRFDFSSDYQAYYCPMVKKKWLQNSVKTTRANNPYAPKMKHCGVKN